MHIESPEEPVSMRNLKLWLSSLQAVEPKAIVKFLYGI